MSTVTMNLDDTGMLNMDMNIDEFGLEQDLNGLDEIDATDMPELPALGNPFDADELGPAQMTDVLSGDVSDIPLPVLGSSVDWVHARTSIKLEEIKLEAVEEPANPAPQPVMPKAKPRAKAAAKSGVKRARSGKRSPTTPPARSTIQQVSVATTAGSSSIASSNSSNSSSSVGSYITSTGNPPVSPLMSEPSSPERYTGETEDYLTPPKAAKKRAVATQGLSRPKMSEVVKVEDSDLAETDGIPDLDMDFSSSALGPMAYDPKMIEAQRELRLKRNRQAAQQFRKRKKEYIQSLERDVDRLRQENIQLRARLSSSGVENNMLRGENAFLQGVVRKRGGAPAAELGGSSGHVPVHTMPRTSPAKKVVGAMCAALMVIGMVYTTAGQPAESQALVLTSGPAATGPPTALQRRMLRARSNNESSGEAVPLGGRLWNGTWMVPTAIDWNGSKDTTNASAAVGGPDTWLSLITADTPVTGRPQPAFGFGSGKQQPLHDVHSGFLHRDPVTGELLMDWELLARCEAHNIDYNPTRWP